jgi:tRNA dimethylallyltransferase
VIVNADAMQVFKGWPILTAQPPAEDHALAPHVLYDHAAYDASFTLGDWLAAVGPLLQGDQRPIIVGGTGLYLSTLVRGISKIPETPPALRAQSSTLPVAQMRAALDPATLAMIDQQNPRRVQRAWEVQQITGEGMAAWHDRRTPPLLPQHDATCIVMDAPKEWLTPRIAQRFDLMIAAGALDEARAMQPHWNPKLQSSKAIGAAWMIAHLNGEMSREELRERTIIATRQYAKRQRTWFRSNMADWQSLAISSTNLSTALRFLT